MKRGSSSSCAVERVGVSGCRRRGLLDPEGDVSKQPVDTFHLRGGQARGARRLFADGRQVGQQRLDVAVDLGGQRVDTSSQSLSVDDDPHLDGRHHGDGQRDDAEENRPPLAHTVSSPARVFVYASRPRSIAEAS
jgi:hypothetical protein